ncbi:serine/threonine-protein kinase [Streptomyces sp. NPDC057291]|uniref:serine/threonine-protein kinase n=1 Tax=Streptomyces sp. NPDC057291 TaxID=3346087 RepID=UPI00362991B8
MWELGEDDPRSIGSFRPVARLGSGGMGTVYLAVQNGAGGQVAVKTIRSEYAQEEGFRRRFTREATAASSVRSPYTVRVVGFDTQGRHPWLATEYVDGLSLRDHVQRHGALRLHAVVDLALGLSFGLASIHKAGLVHRDLKPGNVLLTADGPKIIDFGLAYAADFSHATHTGTVLGTPGYFSPEQVQGQPVSAASDVFALGAVLTFASSGDHAFRGVTPLTAQYHVVHEEPCLSEVPEELRGLITACMHRIRVNGRLWPRSSRTSRPCAPTATRRLRPSSAGPLRMPREGRQPLMSRSPLFPPLAPRAAGAGGLPLPCRVWCCWPLERPSGPGFSRRTTAPTPELPSRPPLPRHPFCTGLRRRRQTKRRSPQTILRRRSRQTRITRRSSTPSSLIP